MSLGTFAWVVRRLRFPDFSMGFAGPILIILPLLKEGVSERWVSGDPDIYFVILCMLV